MKYTTTFRIMFRMSIALCSMFIGAELAFWIWEQKKQSSADNISIKQRKNTTLILAVGDSITQLGYGKILENTKGGDYSLKNAAIAGSGIFTAYDIIKNNLKTLQNQQHEIIVMTGHNDCRYLHEHAQLHIESTENTWSSTVKKLMWKSRSIRFLNLFYRHHQKNQQNFQLNSRQDKEGLRHCHINISSGYKDLVQISYENDLSIHFMTYPFPKNRLKQENWNNFMWMSLFINKHIRTISQQYQIPLIDAEACMQDLDTSNWKNDYFHLQHSGSQKHITCIFNHLGIKP